MISIVVPTYNERQNIEKLVDRTGAALRAAGEPFELIIVDDNSPDGTAAEVRRLQATRPWLQLVVRTTEKDLSTAVIAGWRKARGDVLGCMDADLQHPPEKLRELVVRLRESEADVVVGSRHIRGGGVSDWSLLRRAVSWTATILAAFILPGTLGQATDPMSGFFLVRRRVIEGRALNPIGYKILLEVLARGDYQRVVEVPFIFEERVRGGSKMSGRTVVQYLIHLAGISLQTQEAMRLLKYVLVGAVGALVNFLALMGLLRLYQWPLEGATVLAVFLAMINNFFWNDRFTFWEARLAEPGLGAMARRMVKFCLFSSSGALLNVGIIWLLVGLGAPTIPSVVGGIGIAGLYNFLMNSNLTWRAWWNRKLLARTLQEETEFDVSQESGLAHVPCNLCGCERYALLFSGSKSHLGRVTAQTFRCTSDQHGDFTNIVQCTDCGLLYETPREKETVILGQYAEVQDTIYERESEGRIRTFSRLVEDLSRYVRPGGRLLDLGCYTGVFLDVARRRGWETAGVEPSTWAAGQARARGHRVANGTLAQAGLEANSFAAVTLWDVIEHLHDPRGYVRDIFQLVQPGGVFALSTMDAGCTYARVSGRHWPWYMRMHLYYFTRESITRLLQMAGFEVLAIERHKRIVSLRYFVEKGFSLLGPLAFLGKWVGAPFGRIFVTVDLGDIMNVFARRPAGDAPTAVASAGEEDSRPAALPSS